MGMAIFWDVATLLGDEQHSAHGEGAKARRVLRFCREEPPSPLGVGGMLGFPLPDGACCLSKQRLHQHAARQETAPGVGGAPRPPLCDATSTPAHCGFGFVPHGFRFTD